MQESNTLLPKQNKPSLCYDSWFTIVWKQDGWLNSEIIQFKYDCYIIVSQWPTLISTLGLIEGKTRAGIEEKQSITFLSVNSSLLAMVNGTTKGPKVAMRTPGSQPGTGRRWAGSSTRALVFLWPCLPRLWLPHSPVMPSGVGVHLLHTNLVVLSAFLACSRWLCHCLLPLPTSEMASLVFFCVYHETSSVCRVPYSRDVVLSDSH